MCFSADCGRIQIYNQGDYPNIVYSRDSRSLADNGAIIEFTLSENSSGGFSVGGIGCIPTCRWQLTRGDVRVLPSAK